MHPSRSEYIGKGLPAAIGQYSTPVTATGHATNGQSPEISALEAIGNRVQNLAIRLDDTNRHTLAFIERVSGSEPSRPEPVSNARDGGSIMPSLATIDALLSMLDAYVCEADRLSSKLPRIG